MNVIKENKFIISIASVSLLILVGAIVLVSRMEGPPQIDAAENVKAEVDETEYSWGEIGIDKGNVEKTFTIKNSGEGNLKLANVKTSCMCTTAKLTIGNSQSPDFGMHSNSPWVGEVPSGEEAELQVIFDPDYHGPSGIGEITREVVVETNDKESPRLIFTLTASVVK